MPATVTEVQNLIQAQFAGADTAGVREEGNRIGGVIFWAGFSNMDIGERNRMVTERIRNRLGLRGMNIGILFPLAPGEKL